MIKYKDLGTAPAEVDKATTLIIGLVGWLHGLKWGPDCRKLLFHEKNAIPVA